MSEATVERDIGRLLESVEGLRRDFEQADKKSDEHRAMVYTRLQDAELLSTQRHAENKAAFASIIVTQSGHGERITSMEPEVESIRRIRQRGIGVLFAVGFVFTLLGVTVADGWGKVVDTVAGWFAGG